MTHQLVIVGAGGFSRETAEAVRCGTEWELLGFLDDDPSRQGTEIDGTPVIGPLDALATLPASVKVVIGVGRPDNYWARLRITERLGLPRDRYATIVHPAAALAPSTRVGTGTVLLANVVATASVAIGDHVAVMPGTVLTHDDTIGDFATIASGVRLGGSVHVETGAYIGAGVLVRENRTVGAWSMIGMGSVVTRDVPPGELWYGAPARFRRAAPVPTELIEAQRT